MELFAPSRYQARPSFLMGPILAAKASCGVKLSLVITCVYLPERGIRPPMIISTELGKPASKGLFGGKPVLMTMFALHRPHGRRPGMTMAKLLVVAKQGVNELIETRAGHQNL